MKFLTYDEAFNASKNKNLISKIYKKGLILANDSLIRDLNRYLEIYGKKAESIVFDLLKINESTTILQQNAIAILGAFMNKFNRSEKFVPEKNCSREKLLLFLEKELTEEILYFGNIECVMVFKNGEFIDFMDHVDQYDFYPDEFYVKAPLKKALFAVIKSLYPNFKTSAIVISINRRLKNLNVRELAKKIELSFQAISNYENNLREPSDFSKKKIAKALEFDLKEFNSNYWDL
ncbi:helix-turn-helix transcriptional regulator [Trichlorobacter sp.]|uniref:helix-turn-helix domain-containing protein n=1 Tax=Trichlorobacter sp. TaxID=2911007 RepID=UPI002A367512|nr:helix-turn-helix transcriptional regulator [Trichlorobacter sp.]MDY0385469.1 helix-turn-helix transcriptional regulator [Trichlorobacter sp.]